MRNLKRLTAAMLAGGLALTLTVPALAVADDAGYSDVNADSPYAEAVLYCREHGLMGGVEDGRFDPEGAMTRAVLATVLYRMADTPTVSGSDDFVDTADGMWYSDAILWASQRGLMNGYGDGMFGTDDLVTRQDMITILWRYAERPAASHVSEFEDKDVISDYAVAAVDWAADSGIVDGESGGRFEPMEQVSRAEIAQALMSFARWAQSELRPEPEPDPEVSLTPSGKTEEQAIASEAELPDRD